MIPRIYVFKVNLKNKILNSLGIFLLIAFVGATGLTKYWYKEPFIF